MHVSNPEELYCSAHLRVLKQNRQKVKQGKVNRRGPGQWEDRQAQALAAPVAAQHDQGNSAETSEEQKENNRVQMLNDSKTSQNKRDRHPNLLNGAPAQPNAKLTYVPSGIDLSRTYTLAEYEESVSKAKAELKQQIERQLLEGVKSSSKKVEEKKKENKEVDRVHLEQAGNIPTGGSSCAAKKVENSNEKKEPEPVLVQDVVKSDSFDQNEIAACQPTQFQPRVEKMVEKKETLLPLEGDEDEPVRIFQEKTPAENILSDGRGGVVDFKENNACVATHAAAPVHDQADEHHDFDLAEKKSKTESSLPRSIKAEDETSLSVEPRHELPTTTTSSNQDGVKTDKKTTKNVDKVDKPTTCNYSLLNPPAGDESLVPLTAPP
ncbi:unnamed protein product, partial [Amoebophrya sp. A120]|eukprot:GSA120T00025469001.1